MDDTTTLELGALRAGFSGEILTARDGARYDELRAVFNALFDRRPAAIARATCDGDVVAAVLFAQSARLPLAVRSGGHSVAGYSAIDGGLLLDLRPMAAVQVDPVARTVRVGPGATWGEVDAASQRHGLATTGGRMTTTGVAGFVLGSGSGWLERMHGWACDNLLSARLVTADGRVVTASETENAELFWGLRGGGGNFGVVTELVLRLHPVGPEIYGGLLIYPRSRAIEVAGRFRDAMLSAPREVTGGILLATAPPAPFIPPELHGRPVATVLVAHLGDPIGGPAALAPLLEGLEAPAANTLAPVTYQELQAITDPANPPGRRNYWHSDLLADLTDDAIAALVDRADRSTSPASVIIVGRAGGAIDDVPADRTPLRGRSAPWFYHCYGIWSDDDDLRHREWVAATGDRLRPWAIAGISPNFLTDVDQARVISTFGEDAHRRLVALKDRYDPENLFRRNQNIRPS